MSYYRPHFPAAGSKGGNSRSLESEHGVHGVPVCAVSCLGPDHAQDFAAGAAPSYGNCPSLIGFPRSEQHIGQGHTAESIFSSGASNPTRARCGGSEVFDASSTHLNNRPVSCWIGDPQVHTGKDHAIRATVSTRETSDNIHSNNDDDNGHKTSDSMKAREDELSLAQEAQARRRLSRRVPNENAALCDKWGKVFIIEGGRRRRRLRLRHRTSKVDDSPAAKRVQVGNRSRVDHRQELRQPTGFCCT